MSECTQQPTVERCMVQEALTVEVTDAWGSAQAASDVTLRLVSATLDGQAGLQDVAASRKGGSFHIDWASGFSAAGVAQ